MNYAENLREIQERVTRACERAGRDVSDVRLIAVSKVQSADAVEALYRAGQRDFGENYVQEMVSKAEELARRGCTEIRWHMIGHLQTNKVKAALGCAQVVHTVDTLKLAAELAKRWECGARLPVFIEVNIDEQESKAGVAPTETYGFVSEVASQFGERLEIQGLMCMPDPTRGASALQSAFARLRALEARCRPHTGGRLSMGMSSDFEVAIAEGATEVRVGTALFGARV